MVLKIIVAIVCAFFAIFGVTNFLPNYYWFQSFQVEDIFLQIFTYKLTVFFGVFIPVLFIFYINNKCLNSVIKKATIIKDSESNQPLWVQKLMVIINTVLGPYRSSAEWMNNKVLFGISAFVSFIIARIAVRYWDYLLLYFVKQPFQTLKPLSLMC